MSEGDASTQVIASLYCIATRIPRRDKINSHICSIILEKKRPTKPSDKVATKLKQVRTEDTKLKRTNEKKPKPDPKPVHTKKRRKKTENTFIHNYKANIYCTLHLQSHLQLHFKLPTIVTYSNK